ncbi:hypothetical protein DdX_14587 [Ditylenchus destructor]|uniref:Uncharacterized protein n=1 Tax=Ditylenchus destructor TaxID=166010 RepID=A0AAD4R1T0_9BILA|nr:hypothetical protein DdX_14587 [Ditylenchus destructor]
MGPKVFYLFAALLLVCQVCHSQLALPVDECHPELRPCPDGLECRRYEGCNRRKRALEHSHQCPFACVPPFVHNTRTTTPDYTE